LKALFQPNDYPDVLSGLAESDDAAIYRISEDRAVIFTTDFFTPIVDVPRDYGAIAAANALSDVYAMGGEVLLALNIACFPKDMDESIIRDILLGGAEIIKESGGVLAGGHTIDDDEPKYGLAVMGSVHPERIVEKSGAEPGDLLVLSKPLGTGIITTALKGDMAEERHVVPAVASMRRLNKTAADCMMNAGCVTATDITGYGFIGHALEIARHSDVRLSFNTDKIPFLPGAMTYAGMWLFPAGSNHNREAFECKTVFHDHIQEELRMLLYTPETSGGLLLCIKPGRLQGLLDDAESNQQEMWVVGTVQSGNGLAFV
jgi:selenide, water dikinase